MNKKDQLLLLKTENYTSLDALPMLEAGSMIKINAYWNDNDNKGSAQYKFYVKEWNAPIYSIDDNTISAGEFFAVRVKNVDAPHKIEFSSIPEIHAEPIFYSDRDGAFALIPIKKELAAPCNYTFSFKYGTDIQKIPVSVEPRAIRDDKKCHVSIPLTDNELNNIYKILSDTSLRSENADKFIDKLLDYSPDNTGSAKLAEVYYSQLNAIPN